MKIRKSVVLTMLRPCSEKNIETFEDSVRKLSMLNVSAVEFFCPFDMTKGRKNVLKRYEMDGIFLAALYQKRNGLNLSSVKIEDRRKAIDKTKLCINAAVEAGADRVLMTSGELPENEDSIEEAYSLLKLSLWELCDYAKEMGVMLTLEPGDRNVQACQLIGPTKLAVKLMKELKEDNITLTMDTSHLAQLSEDVGRSLLLAMPWCRHIHLADCVLKKGNPLYGDRHPSFSNPDVIFGMEKLKGLKNLCEELYADQELTLSFEIINHTPEDDTYFERIIKELEWFFI